MCAVPLNLPVMLKKLEHIVTCSESPHQGMTVPELVAMLHLPLKPSHVSPCIIAPGQLGNLSNGQEMPTRAPT